MLVVIIEVAAVHVSCLLMMMMMMMILRWIMDLFVASSSHRDSVVVGIVANDDLSFTATPSEDHGIDDQYTK